MSKASPKGERHDCMDAEGRATQDAVAEDARNKKSPHLAGFLSKTNYIIVKIKDG
jgi:hypothetical protein